MVSIIDLIKSYDVYILMAITVLTILNIIILIFNSTRVYKLSKKYRKFMRGSKDKNIEELLLDLSDNVNKAMEKTDEVKSYYKDMNHRVENCVQRVSIVRYKAFDDMGSAALSFSIALLDAHDDGIILTGIYGRDECTTYAKPVDKGVPKYDLSDEENKALHEAMIKK